MQLYGVSLPTSQYCSC